MNLNGKTALITGSTSGIGLGIAERLAQAGANILLNGFGDIDAARARVEGFGTKILHHGADLSDPAAIADMQAYADSDLGGIDILVNNAGIQHVAPVVEFPVERWDAVISLNLSAVFHTSRLALPGMLERNWGRIINIASAHGLVGSIEKSAYVAAKHGVVGLTKVIALETAKTGVTCNAICPGWVLTPLVQKQIDKLAEAHGDPERAKRELLSEKHPSVEFVTPEQLGELALFLCSDAAVQVRGAAWSIDGGWTAR